MQSDVHVELTRSATATSTVLMVVDSMEYLMEYLRSSASGGVDDLCYP